MIIKPVLIVVFWSLAIWGAFDMVRGARKMRAPRKYKDAVFAWSERPLSSFNYDRLSWVAISIHGVSVILIGLIEIFSLTMRPFNAIASSFIMMLVLVGIISIVGQIWGSLLFYPIALALAGDRYIAISTEGILWAGNLIPWSAFCCFRLDPETNMIRLWSASLRGTPAFMLNPPKEYVSGLLEIFQSHLPGDNTISPPGFVEQYILPITMAIACIPIVIAAGFMLQLPLEITLIVNGILMYLLMIFGGPVLLRSLLGKNTQPAAVEQHEAIEKDVGVK
jgi:hypothetical protein